MSSSSLRLASLAFLALLAGCNASPLYGSNTVDPVTGQATSTLAALAGRINVVEADTRTDQIVRNALLFRLNGAAAPRDALYEIVLDTSAVSSNVSIQGGGSGVPTASVYRLDVSYQLRRLPGGEVLAEGTRFSTVPFDRSEQLFAGQRALVDARERAGAEVADRITAAITPVLRRAGSPVVAAQAPR